MGPPSPDEVMAMPALPSMRAVRKSSLAAPSDVEACETGAVPDGLAHGEAAQRERRRAASRLSDHGAVGRRAQHAGAVRRRGRRPRARSSCVSPSGGDGAAARGCRRRRSGGAPADAWRRGAARSRRTGVGLARAPAPAGRRSACTLTVAPGGAAPGAREAARHRQLDVVEQDGSRRRRSSDQASDSRESFSADAVERVRPLVAGRRRSRRAPAARRPPCGRSTSRKSALSERLELSR